MFAVNSNGTGFTNVHTFNALSIGPPYPRTNSDGANPHAGLTLWDNTLFGTAETGGSSGYGTVFALNTDGTGFTNLHSFPATAATETGLAYTNTDGATPRGGLLLSGNTLYGTAASGGSGGVGTVFSLSFRPQLTITPSGTNFTLSWPTNVAGFDCTGYVLQSTTNFGSWVWTTNSPAPVVVNGQNTMTNPISGTKQFFRLRQ